MIRSISTKGIPYGEPPEPPDVPDVPVGPTTTPPTAPANPIDTGSTGLPTPPTIPSAPTTPPVVDPAQYQLPANVGYGDNKQASGGWGSPYVGTGWNNLSNFLNKENIAAGQAQEGQPEPMDGSKGRGQSQSAYEDWMWNIGGMTPAPIPQNTGRTDGSIPIEPPSWGSGGGQGNPLRPPAGSPTGMPAPKPVDPWGNFNRYTTNNRKYNTP